ncbi:MAG: helix-turn-helix transcriptional regulator [Candidatus Moraniibacteriota bacterium]
MYTFSELIKKIRDEAGLTQADFADAIGVSAVLITMIETGQKEVSKNFLLKLADRMNVHPSSITPFLFINKENPISSNSKIERSFINWGEKMQTLLIKDRAKNLNKNAKS